MARCLKATAASIAAIFALFWGGVTVIGNFQTIPPILQWIGSHSGWVILLCLLTFLSADRIGKFFAPVKIILIGLDAKGSPLVRLRVVNSDSKEKRVECVPVLQAVDGSGRPDDLRVHSFIRCDGFKDGKSHVMPPGSNFEVVYRGSGGSVAMFNASRSSRDQVKFFVGTVKLEDGTEIRSRHYHIASDQPKEPVIGFDKSSDLTPDQPSEPPPVTKIVDDAIRIAKEDKITFTLYALQKAGIGNLKTEQQFSEACSQLVQHKLPHPLKGFTDIKQNWLRLVRFANEREIDLWNKVAVYDCLQQFHTQPIAEPIPMPELQLRKEIDRWIERGKHLYKRLSDADTQKQAIEDAPDFFDDFELFVEQNFTRVSDYDRLLYFRKFLTLPTASDLATPLKRYQTAVSYIFGNLVIIRNEIK